MLRDMALADVDEVVRIEQAVHAHPWTRGNFADALVNGNLCKVAEKNGELLGYVVLMPAVDEMQLLDIVVAAARQRQGLGRWLLTEALALARAMGMRRMLLEVRPSNLAAGALYRSAGFVEIGLRRGYYPAENNGREDAIVMERVL
jgi:ribosomal-protein-alanine N-acetyltransferase